MRASPLQHLQVRKPRRRMARAAGTTAAALDAPASAAAAGLAHPGELGYLADALAAARRALAAAAAKQRRGPGRGGRVAGAAAAAGLLQRPQARAVLDWSDVVEAEREEEAAILAAGDAAGALPDAGERGPWVGKWRSWMLLPAPRSSTLG
jgi:hypothetical protein